MITGTLFGSVPAWQASNPNLNESLKEGGRSSTVSFRRHRFRSLLVVSEVALALVLLVGAGLLVHSFLRLQQVNPGFQPRNVLTMHLSLPRPKYPVGSQVTAFYQQALEKIAALPGVKQAAVSSALPLQGWSFGMPFSVEGRPPQNASERSGAHFQMIGPNYFRAMGIPLIKGRSFTEQDIAATTPVAIINGTMVRVFPKGIHGKTAAR